MKWLFFTLIFFLSLQITVFSQSTSKIFRLDGGRVSGVINLSRSPLSDYSFGNFSAQGSYYHWMNQAVNPAFSSTFNRSTVVIQAGPELSVDPFHFVDVNTRVHSSLDRAIANYRTKSTEVFYPKIDGFFKTNKAWGEGFISAPLGKWHFTLAYKKLFQAAMSSKLSGAETGISTLVDMGGGTKSKVLFTAFVESLVDFSFLVDQKTFIFSRIVKNQYGLGMSIDRLGGRADFYGRMNVQGDMSFNGQEYIFNDPNDSWYNSLNQSLDGSFRGKSWRMSIGGWHTLNRNIILDLSFKTGSSLKMHGNLDIVQNKIPALNIDAISSNDGNAEILDPVKLNLSQLTLTKAEKNKTYSELLIKYPAQIHAGFLLRKGNFYWYHNLSASFGASGISYGPSDFNVNNGINYVSVIGISNFCFDVGIVSSKMSASKIKHLTLSESKIWIPQFNFGYGKVIQKHYLVLGKIEVIPNPMFYLSMGFRY